MGTYDFGHVDLFLMRGKCLINFAPRFEQLKWLKGLQLNYFRRFLIRRTTERGRGGGVPHSQTTDSAISRSPNEIPSKVDLTDSQIRATLLPINGLLYIPRLRSVQLG